MYKLINHDCIEVMATIPDNKIDLIVTDPPYLMNYSTRYRKDKSHDFCTPIISDNDEELISKYIKECYRILKDNCAAYIFCNSNKIDFFKKEIESAGFNIKNIIVWEKNNHTAGDLVAAFGKQYEFIIYANKGRCPIRGKRITDIWKFDKIPPNKAVHQNQKPVDLLIQCIEKSSNKGGLIFDGFMGSGSTGVACELTDRNFLGIEIDKKYFDIAKERIERR